MFLKFLLERSMRIQAGLVDQLFNSSEKRLARTLLLMAEFGRQGERETFIPPITQETLAEMVGTTRSRVSFFMDGFRKLGLIEYNGRIKVHKSLVNVILHDHFTEQQLCVNGEATGGSVQERVHDKVIEIEDPRCKDQFDGAAIELEDPRYKGQFNGVVVEMEDPRCKSPFNSVETEMEDPRCKNPLRMW